MTQEWKKNGREGFAPAPSAGKASGKRFPGLAASDLPWDSRSKASAPAMFIDSVIPNEGARTQILCGLMYVDHTKIRTSTHFNVLQAAITSAVTAPQRHKLDQSPLFHAIDT